MLALEASILEFVRKYGSGDVDVDEFLTRLKSFKNAHPDDAKILINGDENAPFNQAIYVFDEVRKSGIQKVLIETRVKPPTS